MYINDLLTTIDDIRAAHMTADEPLIDAAAYVDDTLVSVSHRDPFVVVSFVNSVLGSVTAWSHTWRMQFNPSKIVSMPFTMKRLGERPSGIDFCGQLVEFARSHCHLGVVISDNLRFSEHIRSVCACGNRELYVLRILSRRVRNNWQLLIRLYKALSFHIWNMLYAGLFLMY